MRTSIRTSLVAGTVLAGILGWAGASPGLAADSGGIVWPAVSADELKGERARGVVDDFEMEAKIDGGKTSVDGAEMNNVISDGAFTGASGIVNVIQNNGNQAIIQNGVIVNVNVYQDALPAPQ